MFGSKKRIAELEKLTDWLEIRVNALEYKVNVPKHLLDPEAGNLIAPHEKPRNPTTIELMERGSEAASKNRGQ